MIGELLAKVKNLAAREVEDATKDYWSAVRAVGGGKAVDPAKLLGVLKAAGRNPEQFEADAALYAKRVQLRATADERPKHERHRVAAEAKLREMDAAHEAAVAAYEAARWPVAAEVDDLGKRIAASEQARNDLVTSCAYPDLLERVRQANKVLNAARTRLHDLEQQLRVAEEKYGHAKTWHGRSIPERFESFNYARDLELYGRAVQQLPALITEAREAVAKAEAEHADAQAALLAP